MSEMAVLIPSNIYEDNLEEENTVYDLSFRLLDKVPEIQNHLLQVLYLQNNCISMLPEDFFPALPNLTWLDLRDNCLTDIPSNIQHHQSLTHLLLQNNRISALPNELGTVNLKVLQINGNPITYPPKNIIDKGIIRVLSFLKENLVGKNRSDASISDTASVNGLPISEPRSYNSVVDVDKLNALTKTLSIQFSEKEVENSDNEYNGRLKNKCRRLPNSRKRALPFYCQSSKYVKPVRPLGGNVAKEKIKESFLKELAVKQHKEMLAAREKVLQDRKTLEYLKKWRHTYKDNQLFSSSQLVPRICPYDTSPEYMTLLNREDIEKDLPDKYKKRLVRRSKQTLPRKSNNNVHLAMKIKQLFDNLESVDLRRQGMSPRTEQKILLNEIEKISEIRQKLHELSTTNGKSVSSD